MSSKKAIATRDAQGNSICGQCRNQVDEYAVTCPHCTSDLYTRRGKYIRRAFGALGGLMILVGLSMIVDGGTAEFIGGLISMIIGAVGVYVGWDMLRSRPNRELRLADRFPF